MEWVQALTVIASLTAVIGIVANLLNKRIEDTNRRIEDTNRRIDDLKDDIRELRQEIREIRQLLYKAFEAPHREEK
ncbi:hypothetical protein Hydth_1648 [Hydrogenobacter thermophilus TK-6]|uniref:Uncharacterized protein n=1 Tax=Hydrogenobacter thermophilus (strain DSM 6534 / IAM 12695 / TK-6) TaxID=608538 RepID=D3DJV7_HYDTT|nr:hypothetical protein [Hydrogenobacter thermophilus]ADO46031.1 hypothetical protein Hydth_1648 [Hydrogenobacter thermophilus TK-6]BAI70109.1 hypothetical protein HTH_1662 [Hydrogenobacter thermophilus TK-6]